MHRWHAPVLLFALSLGVAGAHANGSQGPAAQLGGLWCGAGPLHEFSLRLTQHDQQVEGELLRKGRSRSIEGRVDGSVLRTQSTKVGALVLQQQGDELMVTGGDGLIALARGTSFRRSERESCTG